MNIALAQLNYHIGNFDANTQKIIQHIQAAEQQGAELVIFSELSVCGYPPQDLLGHKDFVDKCKESLRQIAGYCRNISAIVGAPLFNHHLQGKPLHNAACLLTNGNIDEIRYKSLLPTYDIFDEYRYFESAHHFNILDFKGLKIALTICEDLWDEQPANTPLGRNNLYTVTPMEELIKQNPDLIINIAASPFACDKIEDKHQIFVNNTQKYNLPLVYVNQTGAQTELIFEGCSKVLNAGGQTLYEAASFTEDFMLIDTRELASEASSSPRHSRGRDPIPDIHQALITGIQDFFGKMNFSKAVIGLSGGIDSGASLALTAEALGPDHVKAVLMPSHYSSGHSISDSEQLCKNLGVAYDTLAIHSIFEQFKHVLNPLFQDYSEDVTEENIQARIRATLLMAISNKFGHILLNTSNKSEAAVGYGTLYGDMAGGLSIIGDVYKTDLYRLAEYINQEKEIIPGNILTKAPSAELKPDQKDTDSLPEYQTLDQILYQYIELQKPIAEIINHGFDPQLVKRVVNLINANEYKRYQAPPMLRISSKAFGMGRRMPLVAKYEV